MNAVQVNETVRTTFEVMARNVFRKYKALYPHELARQFNDEFDAIEGIYKVLHRNAVTADITDFLARLQKLVDSSITVKPNTAAEDPEEYIAIGDIDIEKLKTAFAKAPHKNSITYNLQEAIDRKLQQMLRQNPLRLEFYDRYKEIIAQYNQGKSFENTERAFQNLTSFLAELNAEEVRVLEESDGDEELLAIFDLLVKGKTLTDAKRKRSRKLPQTPSRSSRRNCASNGGGKAARSPLPCACSSRTALFTSQRRITPTKSSRPGRSPYTSTSTPVTTAAAKVSTNKPARPEKTNAPPVAWLSPFG